MGPCSFLSSQLKVRRRGQKILRFTSIPQMLTMNLGVFFSPRKMSGQKNNQHNNKAWCTIGTLINAQPSPCCDPLLFQLVRNMVIPTAHLLITISTAQNSIFFVQSDQFSFRLKAGKKNKHSKINIIINARPFGPLWMNKKNKQKNHIH